MTRAAVCSSLASLCSLLPPSGPLPRGSLRPRSGPFSVRDPSAWLSGRVALRHRGLLEDLQDRCVHELCHGREADGAKSVPRTPSATQCPSCARGQAGTNRIVFFVTGPVFFRYRSFELFGWPGPSGRWQVCRVLLQVYILSPFRPRVTGDSSSLSHAGESHRTISSIASGGRVCLGIAFVAFGVEETLLCLGFAHCKLWSSRNFLSVRKRCERAGQ